MKIVVDLNTFLMGDLIDLEEAGGSLTDMQSAKTIVALVWLSRRKDDPTFTFEDAKKIPVGDLDISVAEPEGVANPKGAGSLSSVAVG